MTPEQLLQPRIKVIADYFHSPYQIGDLLEGNGEDFHVTTTSYADDGEIHYIDNYCEIQTVKKHPHLFRELPWYEDRKPEDMPEYVKRNYEGRTLFYRKELTTIGSMYKYNGLPEGEPPLLNYIDSCLPATREEYEAYQLKIQKS